LKRLVVLLHAGVVVRSSSYLQILGLSCNNQELKLRDLSNLNHVLAQRRLQLSI
jgi:hypothetical protein